MINAPASRSLATQLLVRPIQKRRTGRRRRQAFDFDVVLDGDQNALERQGHLAGLLQGARFGKKLPL